MCAETRPTSVFQHTTRKHKTKIASSLELPGAAPDSVSDSAPAAQAPLAILQTIIYWVMGRFKLKGSASVEEDTVQGCQATVSPTARLFDAVFAKMRTVLWPLLLLQLIYCVDFYYGYLCSLFAV